MSANDNIAFVKVTDQLNNLKLSLSDLLLKLQTTRELVREYNEPDTLGSSHGNATTGDRLS